MSRDEFVVPDERLVPVFDGAGHVDEGTVHTWLDGAFDEAGNAAVAQHVSRCASCAALVAEARGLMAASTRVLAALDVTPHAVPAGVVAPLKTVRNAGMGLRPQWWWKAAAGLIVVVGGTVLVRGELEKSGTTEARTAEARTAEARVAEGDGRATGAGATGVGGTAAGGTGAGTTGAGATGAGATGAGTTGAGTTGAGTTGVDAARGASRLGEAVPVVAAPVPPTPVPPAPVSPAPVPPAPVPLARVRPAPVTQAATNQVADFAGKAVAASPRFEFQQERRSSGGLVATPTLSREQYDRIDDNPFLGVRSNPLSTFSIDVDRASYSNVRRFIMSGQRPPKDAVRIEELINYFPYVLPEPRGNDPVSITTEVIAAPWQPQHRLVRIALQAQRIETAQLPPNNLVFLIDVSGSMNEWNKLPLVKQALRLLVNELRPQDRVAIVAYAGAAGLVLPSTSGEQKTRIMEAIERLESGGSTAGGAGIELAYRTAREHFLERGNNRVILATDGDFNVGVSSDGELERLVEQRRRDGTYLTVLGFGTGNVQASKMEKLAKVGNGNFAYVDTPAEARKVLVEEMGATLLTVANDVKLQLEFNPARVQAYRLIGYENRLLATEDFNDDARDAGDIGAGHQVTALYEVVPAGVQGTVVIRGVDSLRYATPDRRFGASASAGGKELLFVKLRYKRPGATGSQLLTHPVTAHLERRASADLDFIAAVASFGMLLRDSEYKGNSSAAQVLEQARAALGTDRGGYRAEFVQLVERWRALGVTAGERR